MGFFLLIIITMIWGMGFIGAKWTLTYHNSVESNFLRYLIASFFVIPLITFKREWKISMEQIKGIFITAIALYCYLAFQVWGLQYTTVAKSGFLTTLYAFFTPIYGYFVYKNRFHPLYWALVLLGIFGIFLMCDMELSNFNRGDLITIICAIGGSFHIIFVEKYLKLFKSGLMFNAFQILAVTVVAGLVFIFDKNNTNYKIIFDIHELPIKGYFILSIMSTLLAFTLQVYAQKKVPSHVVCVLFLLESPFSAIFGYMFFGERLTTLAMIGCTIIMISVALIPKYSTIKSRQA